MIDRLSGQVVHIDFGDCFDVAVLRDKFPERVPFRLTRMLVNAMEVSGVEGTYRGVCESVLSVLRANADSVMTMLEAFVHDPLVNWEGIQTKEGESKDKSEAPPEEDGDSTNKVEQMKSSALRNAMETAIAEGGAMDLMRREGISHIRGNAGGSLRRTGSNLHQFVSAVATPEDDDGDGEDGVFEENLNERAVAVLARVREKLTGRDRIAYRIGHSGDVLPDKGDSEMEENVVAYGMNEEDEPLDVATQVDRLVREAISHENLSQNYLGWCAFW